MTEWNLKGKKAIVTGGSKGIGKAIVSELLRLGAAVMFTARNEWEVRNVELQLQNDGYDVAGLVADVSKANCRNEIVHWAGEHWNDLDILVNNAGINVRKPTNDYSLHEYTQVMNINLYAPFELCRLLFPLLKKSSHASIVNIASVAGSFDVHTGAPYAMSKAGLIQLSKTLASEWAGDNIRVNSVSPWFTETPLTSGLLSDASRLAAITSKTPLKRIAQPEEIAAMVAFLAMNKSSFITGQNFSVDGGITTRLL